VRQLIIGKKRRIRKDCGDEGKGIFMEIFHLQPQISNANFSQGARIPHLSS
jgi:hypothetical protein